MPCGNCPPPRSARRTSLTCAVWPPCIGWHVPPSHQPPRLCMQASRNPPVSSHRSVEMRAHRSFCSVVRHVAVANRTITCMFLAGLLQCFCPAVCSCNVPTLGQMCTLLLQRYVSDLCDTVLTCFAIRLLAAYQVRRRIPVTPAAARLRVVFTCRATPDAAHVLLPRPLADLLILTTSAPTSQQDLANTTKPPSYSQVMPLPVCCAGLAPAMASVMLIPAWPLTMCSRPPAAVILKPRVGKTFLRCA